MYWHNIRLIQPKKHKSSIVICSLVLCFRYAFLWHFIDREKWWAKTTYVSGTIESRILFTIYSNGVIEMTYDCARVCVCVYLLDSSKVVLLKLFIDHTTHRIKSDWTNDRQMYRQKAEWNCVRKCIRGWIHVCVCMIALLYCICLPKNIEKLLNGCITAAHQE